MTEHLAMIDAFVDSFIANACLEDALQLKWERAAILQGRTL